MSDFGSNIFDEDDSSPAKARPRRAEREQPPPPRAAADEPMLDEPMPDGPLPDEEVESSPPPPIHDEATEPEPRRAPEPERQERHERRPRHEDRPHHDERPRHEDRPHHGDRPPHDRPRQDEPPRHHERPRHHEHPRRDERPRHDEPRHESRHQSYPPQQRDGGRGPDERRDERDAPRHERPFREERAPHADRPPHERSQRDRPHHEGRPYEPRGDRPAPATARPPASPAPAPRELAPPTAPGTVALLIDLVALQAQAQTQGGELAFRRLRDGLAAGRTVDRAFCFAPGGTTPPAGFDLAPSQDTLVGGIRFAAKALDLLGRSGEIVLAPPSEAMRELANTLRKAGHRVELAGFPAEGEETPGTRRLGRDCLFVP